MSFTDSRRYSKSPERHRLKYKNLNYKISVIWFQKFIYSVIKMSLKKRFAKHLWSEVNQIVNLSTILKKVYQNNLPNFEKVNLVQ